MSKKMKKSIRSLYEDYPELAIVIEVMCNRVGANPAKIDFGEEGWYKKHEWSMDEYKKFIEWLEKRIMTNSSLRKELTGRSSRIRKRDASSVAHFFGLQWGWKFRKE